jgi:FkbM family methyltransferase
MTTNGFYVDVGANHPSKLSNTFKLYKLGMRGIAIEPNPVMCRVYERFRPHDVCLCAGLGLTDDLQRLKITTYHGLSTFSTDSVSGPVSNTRYVPVTTLKRVLEAVRLPGRPYFALLSIDCEGWDELVLRGNDWERQRPMYIITEFWSPESRHKTTTYLSKQQYELEEVIGCNLVFRDRGGTGAARTAYAERAQDPAVVC